MDWIIGLVPWWVWLALAAMVIGGFWRAVGWQSAAVAAIGLLAVLGYGKGRSDASRDERAKIDRRNAQAMKDRKEIEDETDALGSNDIDSNFARWMRDDDTR